MFYLNRLALKHIFDKKSMEINEHRLLDEGIKWWTRKDDMTFCEKKELKIIIDCLLLDEEGKYDKEKHIYKRANIDYRKVYTDGI